MKRKWTLIAAIVAAMAMLLSFPLIGCAQTTTETTAAAAETTAAAAETTEAAAETTEAAAAAGDQFITIYWAQWAPSDYLQALSADFTAKTGIEVIVQQEPWETFVQKYNTEMIAQSDAWDIIVGDSQDVGTMVLGGHYVDLTDWMVANGVDKSMTAASLTYYSEYPKGSGQYWGVPTEGDCLGWAYRKDLFEDPDNMAAFKEEYGYDLGVPKDWDMMLDIAQFFYDPDNNFYGCAVYGDNGYDSMVMFLEQEIWTWGGDLGDYTTNQVEGILNSAASVQGAEHYREMFKLTPPAFNDAFYVKSNDAFTAGLVPMSCNYYAFLPALASEATNPFAADTGYFACPPQVAADGNTYQAAALGGQAASIVTYSKKQDLAMQWLEWFIQPETQMEWAKLGGYTCHIETLESDEFINATPYNAAFAESMAILKDFWSVPEYSELLTICAQTVGPYIINGEGTAQEALDECAAQWTQVFKDAGYLE